MISGAIKNNFCVLMEMLAHYFLITKQNITKPHCFGSMHHLVMSFIPRELS